jgi:sortase A
MHVEGAGFPWQDGANVYIAGDRLGFPGTGSDRLFWNLDENLDELETGDRVVLEDADGRRYEYAVFRRKIVGPREVSVAEPVPDKSIVSLQTCTLPDYAERLVVQAALVHGPLRTSLPRPTG